MKNRMVYRLTDQNSQAHEILNQLRDEEIQKDRSKFRENLRRIGFLLGYEMSKSLDFNLTKVETQLGIAISKTVVKPLVLATIMRAGLSMHNGLLDLFGDAENAFISAYRKHHKDGTFEIALQYSTCPSIDDKVLVLVDAMLATGSSMEKAIRELLESGKPAEIHILTAIASTEGINHIRRLFPKVKIWVGDQDEELTAKYFIVPGLGDAGDLAYGEKLID